MILFLLFNIFSVYFASQMLQMSSLISSDAHNNVTPFALVYDALYSILVVLGLHQLHRMLTKKLMTRQKVVYTVCCHAGAIIFALCGQIPAVGHFALTKGFWERLTWKGKIIIGSLAVVIAALVYVQGRRAWAKKQCCRQWFPWISIIITWAIMWSIIYTEDISIHVHVHHALFAGFFSCWFDDFTSWLDLVVNAFLIGIVIEGIDFFGIGELTLFMMKNSPHMDTTGVVIAWTAALAGLLTTICCQKAPGGEPASQISPCGTNSTTKDNFAHLA